MYTITYSCNLKVTGPWGRKIVPNVQPHDKPRSLALKAAMRNNDNGFLQTRLMVGTLDLVWFRPSWYYIFIKCVGSRSESRYKIQNYFHNSTELKKNFDFVAVASRASLTTEYHIANRHGTLILIETAYITRRKEGA